MIIHCKFTNDMTLEDITEALKIANALGSKKDFDGLEGVASPNKIVKACPSCPWLQKAT